ncbi:MAG: FAD-binding protein [Gracilibacteraceae bacterium]|jgi:electron transfer flavoprotein alpha subunit|nr:FAD-binding protein [Gracilibacteraceae bacterium]
MAKIRNIWVTGERVADFGDLIAGGKTLADSVSVVVFADGAQAAEAFAAGADRVYVVPGQDLLLEDYVPSFQNLLAREKPRLLLLKTSKRMRLVAGRLAAAAGTGVITDVTALTLEGEAIIGEHMVYGGSAQRLEKSDGGLCLALVGGGVFAPSPPVAGSGEVVQADFVAPARQAKLLERKPIAGEAVNLAAAKKVVGIGRGLARQEDLALAERLAGALGAEMACTRPIAEGVNWMARERYIGVSGAMLKPDYYLAVGISGQVQHMVGVTGAKTIIAINNDKNAAIFKYADYGLVADLYTALPKLIDLIREERVNRKE